MRVIAGSCRSLPLKTLPGIQTRPTTDRIKETLFNILMPYIPGARFLDLFAGSGGIGIEALSRGADRACFVEQNRKAGQVIRDNLAFTRLLDRSDVMVMDVLSALPYLGAFDVIFMDPPYGRGLEKEVLLALSGSQVVHEDSLIVVEAELGTDFSWLGEAGFRVAKEKRYKTNKHIFIRRSE